jgi:hypothetical protein
MARKTTKKGKAARKTAPKRPAKSAKRTTKTAAKKTRPASAKKPALATAAPSRVADSFGAADLLRAWSPSRYSR